jgi:CDP-diglyceride synthetase
MALILMLLAACVSDIGGLMFGVSFGKHKIAPIISPKKT